MIDCMILGYKFFKSGLDCGGSDVFFSWIQLTHNRTPFRQDTPNPGVYHIRDFIEEADLNPVRKTYGFKRVGRKAPTLGTQRGHMLLPGAYSPPESEVLKPSFFFKACPRHEVTLGVRDKVGFRRNLY